MKKITTFVATLLVATMSIGSVTTYAAETTEVPRKFERSAIGENFKNFKVGFDVNFEKVKSGEYSFDFEKVKLGEYSFEEKQFEDMKNRMVENADNFEFGGFKKIGKRMMDKAVAEMAKDM